MKEGEFQSAAAEAEADAKKLRALRASEYAHWVREGPAPLRWFDVLPLHYLVPIWAGIALLVSRVKSQYLLPVLALVFFLSLVPFTFAMLRSSALYKEIHRYRLAQPSKDSYIVWIAKPGKLPVYRAWSRVLFAMLDSYVITVGLSFFWI